MSRLKDLYVKKIIPEIKKEKNIKNSLEVPSIIKVVVNVGVGRSIKDAKALETVMEGIAKITGQKPKINVARKSIAGFNLREGMKIGTSVTLRGEKMYEFIDRLINIALPRVRDFRGISRKSFDGRGNYSLGIKEHTVFPEVSLDENAVGFGLQINIITTAKNDEEAKILLKHFGFPFKKVENL